MTDSPQRAPTICPQADAVQHEIVLTKQPPADVCTSHAPGRQSTVAGRRVGLTTMVTQISRLRSGTRWISSISAEAQIISVYVFQG